MLKTSSASPRHKRIRAGRETSGLQSFGEGNEIFKLPPEVSKSDGNRSAIIGTLSFPVCWEEGGAKRDNGDIVAAIILRRQPRLLLCAGWSVQSQDHLRPIKDATARTKTLAVVEGKEGAFLIQNGKSHPMGEQCFGTRKQTEEEPERVHKLSRMVPKRSFQFLSRPVLLLICGEILVLQGRNKVDFHSSVENEKALRDAVRANDALILNPTHTRMANDGTIKAWRKFLSKGNRVYLSASNWDFCDVCGWEKKTQSPSDTLHSLWHGGKCKQAVYKAKDEKQSDAFCYREWVLPK
jgi:hypothetical protein